MNKHIKTLLMDQKDSSKNQKINDYLISLPKIKNTNIINLIKYELSITYNYPLLNNENKQTDKYNKLYFTYLKYKCPEYYFTLLELNKHGIHFSNFYNKICGWYFNNEVDSDKLENIDIIIIFYINRCNENTIDKKINELLNKFDIKNINIDKKETFINIYEIKDNGILFLTQDPFDLSKKLYIYVYGICEDTNSFISFSSYYYNSNIKYKKTFITYYKYFTNEIIVDNYINTTVNKLDGIQYGYNSFCFIDKNINNNINNNNNNIINENNYEFKLLNLIELTDLPNNIKIFLKKIKYKDFALLLHEESGCININNLYKFINNSKINNFFIVKENIIIKNESRIKVLSSNILYEPLRIESGEVKDFL
jgi:hypothetical protein